MLEEVVLIKPISIIFCIINILLLLIIDNGEPIISNGITSQGLDIINYIGLNKSSLCKYTGKNITVVIVDSGIGEHKDINKKRIIKSLDLVNGRNDELYDDNGHGTFVAGIIGAKGNRVGIAPEVNFISIKVIDEYGETNENLINLALNWINNNRVFYNIKVVYLSAGITQKSNKKSLIIDQIEQISKQGVVIICPSGNSGPNKESVLFPAISKEVITVGSINNNYTYDLGDATVANFSGRSENYDKPELITLGIDILSLSNSLTDGYNLNSGTSFSAAIVTGVVILILEEQPHLNVDSIRNFLYSNSENIKNTEEKSRNIYFK